MRAFVSKLILFALPVLLLGLSAEWVVRQIPNDYSYKCQLLDHPKEQTQPIETIILGSSHGLYDVNPEYLSHPAFNLAHVSQTLDFDLFLLQKFIGKLAPLKTVILPISYFTLFELLEKTDENWRILNYSLYYHCPYFKHPRFNSEALGSKPTVLFDKMKLFFKKQNLVSVSPSGFGLKYTNVEQEDLVLSGEAAAKRHTYSDRTLLDTNRILLNQFISLCAAKGIRVVLFTPPAYQTYHMNLDAHQLAIMHTTIDTILAQHPHVTYLDFLKDPRFKASDFQDADHLNGDGAHKLTKILDHHLVASP